MVTHPKDRKALKGERPTNAGLNRAGPLVAFDFDGTLTTRDSFTAFVKWRVRALAYYAGMILLAPAAVRYMFDRDRGRIKGAAIRVYLRGQPREALEQAADAFAAAMGPSLFRPDALKVWRRHRAEGARIVIVSASPEEVVAPFAKGLGADALIASHIAYDVAGRVGTGLAGNNCRGPEKVIRLRQMFGPTVRLAAAYGDTSGDREMLAIADQGFMRLFTGHPFKARTARP